MLSFDENGWLFPDVMENKIHDISISELNDLMRLSYEDDGWSQKVQDTVTKRMTDPDTRKSQRMDWVVEEMLLKNTAGTLIRMPFWKDVITFRSRRHFYRGENQQYERSVPSLLRKMAGKTPYECEMIKAVSAMRIMQFAKFILKINVVPYWEAKISDVNYDALAQHYGFETCLLDLTNDFRTALFFATCKYDYETDTYRPLRKEDIEASERSRYGVIFHSPNWAVDYLNGASEWKVEHVSDNRDFPYTFCSGEHDGMAFQIGYQPLMRCHYQSGYIMPMMNSCCLQENPKFEKIRFLQSEELSNQVFEMMDKGKKVFPNEGIRLAFKTLRSIQNSFVFSEDDMNYAYDFGGINKSLFPKIEDLKNGLCTYTIDGHAVVIQKDEVDYHIDDTILSQINECYDNKDLLSEIGGRIFYTPEQRRDREQKCIDIYGRLI